MVHMRSESIGQESASWGGGGGLYAYCTSEPATKLLSEAVSSTGRLMGALLPSRAEMQNLQKAQLDANVCFRWLETNQGNFENIFQIQLS